MPGSEASLDRLFELPPEEFTAARDSLARNLRDGGDREAAAAVRKLRRPTVVAWALNQVSRRHRADVDALLEAGEELRQGQRRLLSGLGPGAMRAAQSKRRELLGRVSGRTAEILGERGTVAEAHRAAIRAALEAASVDGDAAAALLEARLSQPPEAATGFEAAGALTLVPDVEESGPAEARAAGGAPAQASAGDTRAAEQAEVEQAEAERRRAEAEQAAARLAAARRTEIRSAAHARDRRREADRAARAAGEADAEAQRLSRQLEAARDQARRAAQRARRAAADAQEAEELADRHERERQEAEEHANRLAPG